MVPTENPVTRKLGFVRDKPVGVRSTKHDIRIPTWLDASNWRMMAQLMKSLVMKKLARLIGRGTNTSDLGIAKGRDWWIKIPRSWRSKFFWVIIDTKSGGYPSGNPTESAFGQCTRRYKLLVQRFAVL
jgi:hypothetical protein